MSVVARLIELVSEAIAPAPAPGAEEQLAIAALLVHVARADGRIAPAERRQLLRLLRARFRLDDGAAERLIARAEALDRGTDDIADLIEMIGHEASPADRRRLLGMAFAVAAADGNLGEFEDDLVWRLGQLLGLADAEILALRDTTLLPALKPVPER